MSILLQLLFALALDLLSLTVKAIDSEKLNFDALASGANEFVIDYEIQRDFIRLGEIYITDETFGIKYQVLKNQNKITFFWPLEIFEEQGEIELILADGTNLMKENVKYSELTFSEAPSGASKVPTEQRHQNFYPQAEYSFSPSERQLAKIKKSARLTFCLKHLKKEGVSPFKLRKICSTPYQLKQKELVLKPKEAGPKVVFNDPITPLPTTGEIKLNKKEHQTFEFFAQNEQGMIFHFKDSIPNWSSLEILALEANRFRLAGVGPRPFKFLRDHFIYKDKSFFYEYKYQPFSQQMVDFWSFEVQVTDSVVPLTFLNFDGGIYVAKINLKNIPSLNQVPLIKDFSEPHLTYSSNQVIPLQLPGNASPESKAIKRRPNDNLYAWKLESIKRFNSNPYSMLVKYTEEDNAAKTPFVFEIYRGAATDLGVQQTISKIGSTYIQGNNINFNYWIEDGWGLMRSPFLRLHFGIYGKYFQTQKSQNTSEATTVNLDSSNIGIKYRFTPGLWGRDESFGLLGDGQKFRYNEFDFNIFGPGIFWVRTMPRFFDDLLNKLPFLNYPKWVNAEYIQLLPTISPTGTRFGGGFNLNFYGKIMWTQYVYGDLGFGTKSYQLTDPNKDTQSFLKLYYLTFGLGVNF